MDPNENLKEQATLAARILHDHDTRGYPSLKDAVRLADLVEALNEWLANGGFLPKAWNEDLREKRRNFEGGE